jgi:hypothetical protein
MRDRTASDAVFDRWHAETRHELPASPDALVDEIAQHLALEWQRARDSGASTDEADARVRRDLHAWRRRGEYRARAGIRLWLGWGGDLRHGLRSTRRRPMFAAGLVLLAAIGTAASLSTFAIAWASSPGRCRTPTAIALR